MLTDESRSAPLAGRPDLELALQGWSAFRRLCLCRTCWALLAAGLVNLIGGLALGLHGFIPATRIVLDFVTANFAPAVWCMVIYASSELPREAGRDVRALTAAFGALIVATLLAWLLAALVAIGYQRVRGSVDLELSLYVARLVLDLGWNAAHLAALALFGQAVIGRKWLAMLATVAAYAGTNLYFDHDLLRFGAPLGEWSDMSGYGHSLARDIALGLYWTGFCTVLMVIAHLRTATSFAGLRRVLTPAVVALGWGATVVWLVTGSWVFMNADPVETEDIVREPVLIQPVYSRLDLQIDLQPADRRLRSRGTAIVVNRADIAIADVHFLVPAGLVVNALSLTGEPLAADLSSRVRSFRLNRPLAPRETLKVAFDLQSPVGIPARRVLANGTFLTTADVVPTIGLHTADVFFRAAPPVAFRSRLGTSLDQIAIAPGGLLREWKENGARFFEYQTAQPITPAASFHSGRYAVAHADHNGMPIEVFHHAAHAHAVPAMVATASRQLEKLARLGPYPHERFRVVEVPDYRARVRPPGFLAFSWRAPTLRQHDQGALAGVLPYSELAALVGHDDAS